MRLSFELVLVDKAGKIKKKYYFFLPAGRE